MPPKASAKGAVKSGKATKAFATGEIIQRSCCGPNSSAGHPVHFQKHFASHFGYRSPKLQRS